MRTILLIAVLIPIAATACGNNERGTAGNGGGTMVLATPNDAGSLLPPLVNDATGRAVTDQLYDRLAEVGAQLNTIGDNGFAPRLAQKWTWAPDSLSIAFSLDPRARWHDGVPLRASDVRFTHLLYANPKLGSPVTPLLGNVDSVTAKDSLTAIVWFKRHTPSEFFDYVYQEVIVPEHLLKDIPAEQLKTADIARRGVGTGRFRLARWDAGTRIEIVADTTNFRGRAKLDRVIWSVVPDFGAAFAQLLTGQSDMFENVPVTEVAKVDSSATLRAMPYDNLGYLFLGFNTRQAKNPALPHPIFTDRRVRRALSMAVDRRALLKNVYGSFGKLALGPFPTSIVGADTNFRELPFDTAAANALLDSAGWRRPSPGAVRQKNGKPLQFSVMVPTSSKVRMSYAVLLQDQLRKVGAQADLDQVQFNVFLARQDARDFESFITTWNQDPGFGGSAQNWTTKSMAKGGQNAINYSNPVFDALLDSATSSFDPSRAATYAHRAYQTVIDDAPGIWLANAILIAGLHRRIQTAPMRADEAWWPNLADWSIPADRRIDRDRIGLAAKTP